MSHFFTSGGQSFGSISFSISPSIQYSGLISFRMDWLDLVVQGTLKSLLQHHSSKASILWCSAFFTVQLSMHDYWKNHSLDQTDLCWQSNVSAFEYALYLASVLNSYLYYKYSFEGLMLRLKFQYFGHLMGRADLLEKTLMLEKIEGRRGRGRQRMRWVDDITDSLDMI